MDYCHSSGSARPSAADAIESLPADKSVCSVECPWPCFGAANGDHWPGPASRRHTQPRSLWQEIWGDTRALWGNLRKSPAVGKA